MRQGGGTGSTREDRRSACVQAGHHVPVHGIAERGNKWQEDCLETTTTKNISDKYVLAHLNYRVLGTGTFYIIYKFKSCTMMQKSCINLMSLPCYINI